MTVAMETPDTDQQSKDAFVPYRELSRGAVAAAILAVFSLLGFLYVSLLPVALIGMVIGLLAWLSIRRNPLEFTGKWIALFGAIACLMSFVGGVTVHVTAFAKSVPEGYQMISFDDLRSKLRSEEELVPESALQLNGKKVYLRGYVHPSVQSSGPVQRFVLVGDYSTCCFGGQPKLTHMIEVTTPPDKPIQYSLRRRGLAGTLMVDTHLKSVEGLGGVYYQLRADIIQ